MTVFKKSPRIIKLVFEREYEETSVYIRELLLSSLKYQRIIIEEISKYLNIVSVYKILIILFKNIKAK